MVTTSCRPVGVELDPELDDDRPVNRRVSGNEGVGVSKTGVEGVFLARGLSSQIWTRTLLPV